MRTLSRAEFAAESGASDELIDRLVAVGTIRPLPDGSFDARDEAVALTAQAMLESGIELDDLAWVIGDAGFGIRAVRHTLAEPAPRMPERYADFVASLGPAARNLPAVYAALGLPEPEPDDHPRVDEAELIGSFVRLWGLVDPDSDGPVRIGRLLGFATRRMAEGLLDAWDDIARPDASSQGAPTVGERGRPADPTDPEQNLSFDMANVARKLTAFSFERQLEAALNARMVAAVERVLGKAGRLPPRQSRPPAIAFVDLSGFTTLTHEQGDEAAAQMATQLLILAESAVRPEGGRIVKQLGDGALLRFSDRQRALRAVLRLLTAIERAGLPAAHAGIAAGPIVVRDGDVFGRTVNLAARLAAAAPPREIFVEEGVVVALPGGTASFDAVGRIELPGLAEPVAVWRVRQPAAVGP